MIEMTNLVNYIKNSKKLNINLDRSIYSQYNDFNYNDKDIFRAVRILNAGFNDKKNIYRFTH
jgi:hypothetical protein